MKQPLNRRHFLRSSTALIALPALESLGIRRFASAAAATPATPPKRLVFLGFGWGITQESWYPDINQPGKDYVMPAGLKPLERHRADFTVVQGLWNKFSNMGHAGSTMWLTGANRYAQPGQSFHNSISADQVAAAQFGLHTRFASLQLNGAENAESSGHGPGLSMAWDQSGKPVAGHNGPLAAYHRLFSNDATPIEQQKAMLAQRRSVLDTVMENARDLRRGLSRNDGEKLEEYYQASAISKSASAKTSSGLASPARRRTWQNPPPALPGRRRSRSCTTSSSRPCKPTARACSRIASP